MAAAKKRELASWIRNSVLDFAVTHGAPRERCMRARWVLTFKKCEGKYHVAEVSGSQFQRLLGTYEQYHWIGIDPGISGPSNLSFQDSHLESGS